MVVRLHLERRHPAVADVDDSCVLARPLHHLRPAGARCDTDHNFNPFLHFRESRPMLSVARHNLREGVESMKPLSLVIMLVLALFALSAAAQNNGSAANGDFVFALDGATGGIQF